MDYFDNPILSETEYQIINSHYAKNLPQDRLTHANKINIQLQDCKKMCLNIHNVNAQISSALSSTIAEINLIIGNLQACLNVTTESNSTIQFSLFKFINKLLTGASMFLEWEQQEQKEYYKNLALKCHKKIMLCIKNILNSLENSTIKIFKYM